MPFEVLQAWKEHRAQLREERAADALSQRLAAAAKGDGTMEKVMRRWGAQQSTQLLRMVLQAWKDWRMEAVTAKRLAAVSAQTEAAMQKTMLKLAGEQTSLLRQGAWTA